MSTQSRKAPHRNEHPMEVLRNLRAEITQEHNNDGDWGQKPDVPCTPEILKLSRSAPGVELQHNVIEGPWDSQEQYLRAMYDLFRADGVGQLRACVEELRRHPQMDEVESRNRVRIYESAYLTGATLSRKGLAFRIEFNTSRSRRRIQWRVSSRLKTGTAVALTPARDGFDTTCKIAVVVARPLKDLEVEPPAKPAVHIEFGDPEEIEIDPQQEWLMVEASSGYWEGTRHTLKALQQMRLECLPLSKHILGVEPIVAAPADCDIEGLKALALDTHMDLLAKNGHGLDVSQHEALEQILTKSLAIIHGPPGTGKTYISVQALRLLLSTKRAGKGPIIVTAHTNHALDQLLRHIAKFVPKFVRLGGQSSDQDVVIPRTIPVLREQQEKGRGCSRAAPLAIERQVSTDLNKATAALCSARPFALDVFRRAGILNTAQCEQLRKLDHGWGQPFNDSDDPISNYCANQISPFKKRTVDLHMMMGDNYDESEELLPDDADMVGGVVDDRFEDLHGKFFAFSPGYAAAFKKYPAQKIRSFLKNDELDLADVPEKYRGSIYDELRQTLVRQICHQVRSIAAKCKRMALLYRAARWEDDYHLLSGARVIGMTTTGLSKYRPLIKALKPKIVVVEEAAETLEPSIVPAFLPSIEQIVLVGDHKQLRGHCNLREMEGYPFYLDVSMFERLIWNQVDFTQLRLQGRMRPEIRQILSPIYPNLRDHMRVQHQPDVPGMGGVNMGFTHHDFPESSDDQLSKLNKGEALMVAMFCKYLIDNNIAADRITILTFYNGQRKYLGRLLAKYAMSECRVSTVDSFQGEENDIVILSLVRCNDSHELGFLTVENRVCVALSRARQGFYIIGNMTGLYVNSELWREVCQVLEQSNRLFAAMRLVCQKHQTVTWASSGEELQSLDGGCRQPCDEDMPCGHRCQLKCHVISHEEIQCEEPCPMKLSCGHPCQYRCGEAVHACLRCKEKPLATDHPAKASHEDTQPAAERYSPTRDSKTRPSNLGGIPTKPASKKPTLPALPLSHIDGVQAYREFARTGPALNRPLTSGSGDGGGDSGNSAAIEKAAREIAREHYNAADCSATAALATLTANLAATTIAPDSRSSAQGPNAVLPRRRVWTERWVNPAVSTRVRELLEHAATREAE